MSVRRGGTKIRIDKEFCGSLAERLPLRLQEIEDCFVFFGGDKKKTEEMCQVVSSLGLNPSPEMMRLWRIYTRQ